MMEVLNEKINKHCSETQSFSYFIRKDELIFKGGYKHIWFKIECESSLNQELILLSDVIKFKRSRHLDNIYFEVKSGKLLYSEFIFGKHRFFEGKSISPFTRGYISKKLTNIYKYQGNNVLINEVVDFLLLFNSDEILDVINLLRLLATRSLYVIIVSKYINKACYINMMHEKTNMGYFRYLVGLY